VTTRMRVVLLALQVVAIALGIWLGSIAFEALT
jgi:hypothetical protein